jgi:hypothetical protein
MNNQDKNLLADCGTSSLQRPQFSPGQLLDDDDLNAGVTYTRDLTRLLFRSMFGCGVICGLQVKPEWACQRRRWSITVTKGLALDCLGNPIELPADVTFEYNPDCDPLPPALWVTICYSEKCCRPKDVTCSQDDDAQPKPTRVRSGYEIKLALTLPNCACHCSTGDDTPSPTRNAGCCGQTQQTERPMAAPVMEEASTTTSMDVCPCYKPHFDGECECGCNCYCVIIGKIIVPTADASGRPIPDADQKPTADAKMVRRIRPILNGYVDCGSLRFVRKAATRRTQANRPYVEEDHGPDAAEERAPEREYPPNPGA